MKIGQWVALGGIVATLTSLACSADTSTDSDSANLTSGDKDKNKKKTTTKQPTDPAKASPSASTPAASASTSASRPPDPIAACFAQCIGSNAKAKKIRDDDAVCLSKCPGDEGGPSTAASGGGSSSSDTKASPMVACLDDCDRKYNAACHADTASCEASESCVDKCSEAPSGSGDDNAAESKGG